METTTGLGTPQAIFISNQSIHTEAAESPLIASPSKASPPLTPMLTVNPNENSPIKGDQSPKLEIISEGISTEDHLNKRCTDNEKHSSWFGRLYGKSTDKSSRPSNKSEISPPNHQTPEISKKKNNSIPKGILKQPKPIDNEALNRLLEQNLVIERSVHIPPQEIRRLTLNRAHQNHTRASSAISSPRRLCRLTFNKLVEVCEAHGVEDYDRSNIDFIAKSLNPSVVLTIKRELNELKAEMIVHQDSRLNTQFYPLPQPKIVDPNSGVTHSLAAINPTS
jgi:hypothetical protein